MKISFLPKTRQGKLAVILMFSSFILFVIGSVLPYREGYAGFEMIKHNPLQVVLTFLIFAVGITSFAEGLIAVIKHKERSILVFLTLLSGPYNIVSFIGVIIGLFAN